MAASAINFVQTIEQYPCLYNNKLAEYARKDITDTAWSEVAQKTNSSVADCQSRWKNIRNGFVRSLKPTAGGSSRKQKRLYYLHEELQFVLPFVKTTKPTTSEVEPEDIESNSTIEEVPCTRTSTNAFETSSSESEESSFESNTFKKPKIDNVTSEADNKALVDWIKKQELNTIVSPRKMFLLSLLPDVENLSDEQMRKFRIKVLLILEEMLTG